MLQSWTDSNKNGVKTYVAGTIIMMKSYKAFYIFIVAIQYIKACFWPDSEENKQSKKPTSEKDVKKWAEIYERKTQGKISLHLYSNGTQSQCWTTFVSVRKGHWGNMSLGQYDYWFLAFKGTFSSTFDTLSSWQVPL